MNAFIEVKELTKSYGSHRAVTGLSFSIAEGEIFGFLGPNGAGKTTTLRTLMGLLKPTKGTTTISGFDCWQQVSEIKHLVGYLPGEFSFDDTLTGADILAYLSNLRGSVNITYIHTLAERLDLDLTTRFRQYSRGNKQKVGLIQAFMHRPRLLLLDEPTSGLDPLNQQVFYQLVDEARSTGQTIFLSSHILPEIERTCDRIGIIREGELVKVDTVASFKQLRHHQVELSFPSPADPNWFTSIPSVFSATAGSTVCDLKLTVQGTLQYVIQAAAKHGANNLVVCESSLEEVFLTFYKAQKNEAVTQ